MGLPLAPHEERLYEQLEETQRDKQGVQVRRALLRQQMEELTVRWKSLKNREDAICRTLGLTSGPPSPSKGHSPLFNLASGLQQLLTPCRCSQALQMTKRQLLWMRLRQRRGSCGNGTWPG